MQEIQDKIFELFKTLGTAEQEDILYTMMRYFEEIE